MPQNKIAPWNFDTEAELLAAGTALGVFPGDFATAKDTGSMWICIDPSVPEWEPALGRAGTDGMRTVYDMDFVSQPSQDFLPGGDIEVTFGGKQWDVFGTAFAAQHQVVNGTGLVLERNAGTGLQGPFLSLPLYLIGAGTTDQTPGWVLSRRWRITVKWSLATAGVARFGLFGAPSNNMVGTGRRIAGSADMVSVFLLDGTFPDFISAPAEAGRNVMCLDYIPDWHAVMSCGNWGGAGSSLPVGADGMPQLRRRDQTSTIASTPLLLSDNANLSASNRADAQTYRLGFGITDGNGTATFQRVRVECESNG